MFAQQDILIDALWIIGLAGVLVTAIVAVAYGNAQRQRLGQVFSQPAVLLPLCFSLTVFCSSLAFRGYRADQPAPLWETVAWGLLSLLFLSQSVFYGLSGRKRGWTTPVEGEKTVRNNRSAGNQPWSGSQPRPSGQQTEEGLQLQQAEGDSAQYLQLQNEGPDERWQLVDDTPQINWQPIDYGRPQQSSSGWVLPSLIGVALIAVLGYMVWVGIDRLAPGQANLLPVASEEGAGQDDTQLADTATEGQGGEPEVAQLAPAQQDATSTPAPTEAAPAPTPLPFPTTALIERQIATVNNQYGVNARREPSADAEVIRIMPLGETAVVVDEQEDPDLDGNWLQVLLQAEGELGWVASPFVDITTELVPSDPSLPITSAPPASDIGQSAVVTPPIQAQVTISSPAGLNARAAPSADSEIVAVLPNNNTYSAISRSADSRWIQVQLEGDETAWIFLELVIPSNDLNRLPTQEELAAQPAPVATAPTITSTTISTATAPVDTTAPLTSTADITETTTPTATAPVTTTAPVASPPVATTPTTVKVPGDPFTSTVPAGANIVVSGTVGVNARSTASTEGEVLVTMPDGTALPAVGRLADGTWVQIVLPDNRLAWVFAAAVLTSSEVAALPVTTPPAVGAPAEQLAGSTPPAASQPVTTTTPITATTSVTDTTPVVATTGVTATVASLLGTSARATPDTSQPPIQSNIQRGTVLPVVGRNGDSTWIQVQLANGEVAWIFTTSLSLSAAVETLPVITP